MTINNRSERNHRGKCLGWPVTGYGGVDAKFLRIVEFNNCSSRILLYFKTKTDNRVSMSCFNCRLRSCEIMAM